MRLEALVAYRRATFYEIEHGHPGSAAYFARRLVQMFREYMEGTVSW